MREEVADHCRDLRSMSLEGEVARVEEMYHRAGNVASERLGTPRQERRDRSFPMPLGRVVCLSGSNGKLVKCDVTLVVAEQIQLNFVGAGAGQIGLMTGSCGEELLDQNCRVVRILFREEVATLHRLALRVRSPLPPNAQWTAFFCIQSVERATLGP